MKQWIDGIIKNNNTVAVPVMTHPGIELINHTVKEACCDGQVHFEAIKALAEKYPTAAATVIMDLTVEAEAFGAEIHFTEDAVPAVIGHMLNNADDIKALKVPSLKAARVPAYLKANLLSARAISDRPVLSGCIGPFSLAGRLYDMSEIMVLIYQDPDAAHTLLAKCTEFILKYCKALKATGVDGVVGAGRHLQRCAAQLRQHRPLHKGYGGYRLGSLPLRQQVRHERGDKGCAADGSRHGKHRPCVCVQGRHTGTDVRDDDKTAARHEAVSELRSLQWLRHTATHSDGEHRRFLQGARRLQQLLIIIRYGNYIMRNTGLRQ